MASFLLFSCKDANTKKMPETQVMEPPPVFEGITHALINPPVQVLPLPADSAKFKVVMKTLDNAVIEEEGQKAELNFDFESALEIDGRQYRFQHLHFHSPSTHLLEGISFPMEFHVVTQPVDNKETEEYLVIATMFKIGEENPFIREILIQSSDLGRSKSETLLGILKGGQAMINKTNLDMEGFYHYTGFLASEPYSKSVQWYIAHRIFEVSAQQIEQIKALREQE
ncbi:MAG: carbonic anhydrase family protein [Flavobacteriaceae bacterium]